MKNYICKWPNGDVVLISARDRQEVRQILDEAADPGQCEIVRLKGPFALELIPKVPRPPAPPGGDHFPGLDSTYQAPDDPTVRPSVMRWAGISGETFYADVYQEAGGQLSREESAALQRWRAATGTQQQAAGSAVEPWVTEQQLQETGLLDNPYHVQVDLGRTEYGRYGSRLLQKITEAFFPRTYEALKPLQKYSYRESEGSSGRDVAVRRLRAAVSHDVYDEEVAHQMMRQRAKLMVDAQAGDRMALMQLMTDQTVNVYGPEEGDEDDDMDDDDDGSEGGMDILAALRAGQIMGIADQLGANRR